MRDEFKKLHSIKAVTMLGHRKNLTLSTKLSKSLHNFGHRQPKSIDKTYKVSSSQFRPRICAILEISEFKREFKINLYPIREYLFTYIEQCRHELFAYGHHWVERAPNSVVDAVHCLRFVRLVFSWYLKKKVNLKKERRERKNLLSLPQILVSDIPQRTAAGNLCWLSVWLILTVTGFYRVLYRYKLIKIL